jgi:hypothetical protein
MTDSPPPDFKRDLRREIAGYFIVVLCALPIRFWILTTLAEKGGIGAFLSGRLSGYLVMGLIAAIFVSGLRLRTNLALTFILVAI